MKKTKKLSKRRLRSKLIMYLKKGLSTSEISDRLKKRNYEPNSISTVEKALRSLRKEYQAENMFQLGYHIGKEWQEHRNHS